MSFKFEVGERVSHYSGMEELRVGWVVARHSSESYPPYGQRLWHEDATVYSSGEDYLMSCVKKSLQFCDPVRARADNRQWQLELTERWVALSITAGIEEMTKVGFADRLEGRSASTRSGFRIGG